MPDSAHTRPPGEAVPRQPLDPQRMREELAAGDAALYRAYKAGTQVEQLVSMRTYHVDHLLRQLWAAHFPQPAALALVAVGGYGRGELHPHSDIDLLVLIAEADEPAAAPAIERFLTFLWDARLNIGHSVRTPADCVREAERDVTVATNLMETRLLCGDEALYETMLEATGPQHLWPPRDFLQAKLHEQERRHAKYHDTAYKLEPNLKESPGGLRDFQTIVWIARRYFGASDLAELVERGLLTQAEHEMLERGKRYLWKVRFVLHNLAGRAEDRLLFDSQRDLAHAFGYLDDTNNLAIEQFMQRYYRNVMHLQRLNEVLLQWFKETLLHDHDPHQTTPLNSRFVARKGFIDAAGPHVFRDYPPAMLEVFVLLAQHPELEDVRASTIRAIRDNLYRIDERFRDEPLARNLFIDIFRQAQGITHNLRRMNRYGVLAAYLPAFEKIVGRMQYDLFHIYTVDEHTIFVIRNLRRMGIAKHAEELPLAYEVFQHIARPEVLYVAALFHDIAKGRGGDHSELGAEDAARFCVTHGMNTTDTRLVEWLVRRHLFMSATAQRRDLSDPAVIHEFATEVRTLDALNHLYLLTVADIHATNPELWNSWKDNLLRELYLKAKGVLERGLDNPIDAADRIAEIKQSALRLLAEAEVDETATRNIWLDFGERYFLRHTPDEVAWHTRVILSRHSVNEPLVAIRRETARGSTEVFVFVADHDNLFALVTAVLDRLGTDIVDARVITSESGWALDTFLILEGNGDVISDPLRIAEIEQALGDALRNPDRLPRLATRRVPRTLRHFDVPLEVRKVDEQADGVVALEIVVTDAPGLLAKIGRAFVECELRVHNARVVTVGERAEDVFFVSRRDAGPFREDVDLPRLHDAIVAQLARPK